MEPHLSRRQFSQLAASTLAAAFIAPRSALAAPAADFQGYVDVHTHIGTVWNQKLTLTPEALLKWMDEHAIVQAVVLPLVSPESSSYLITTEWVLEQTRPHRDRLIPFCSIDPRTSYTGGVKGLTEMLKAFVDQGCKGFGEHKTGVTIDSDVNMRLYEACSNLKLPVLFHLDNIRNTDTPGLPGLERVLKAFPDIPFIGHGPGWWASISGDVDAKGLGGYPKTKVAPGGAMDRLMAAYPNIYADLSAGSGANALSRDMEHALQFILRRQDRIMFGTDYLMPHQEVNQFKVLAELNLPPDVQAKVYRDNARRVIGIAA